MKRFRFKPSADVAFFAGSAAAALLLGGTCVASIVEGRQNAPFARSETCIIGASLSDVVGSAPQFLGSVSASNTVVVFGDYECPPCARMHQEMASWLPTQKGLRYTFRNYPLDMHPYAYDAALAAEAAREQNKFWEMHDLLYQNQDALGKKEINAYAVQIGFDLKRFHHSLQTTAKTQVETDRAAANKLGIHSTPTVLLCLPNGQVQVVNLAYLKSHF